MGYYHENRKRARTTNNEPTKTDQSQAASTDLNLIIKQYGITGRVPAPTAEPMSGDFTQLPDNLRDMIETARMLDTMRAKLPKDLRHKPLEELVLLTHEQLHNILHPAPAPTPATTEEKK